MPVYTVKVKWGKETFKDVQVDTDSEILDFKTQLYSLSCVPVERQKIMCGGKTLKDDEWNIALKNVRDPSPIVQSHYEVSFVVIFREPLYYF